MKQLILKTTLKHIKAREIRSSYQTNLITFCDETAGLVDEGREVDVVCLDFSKVCGTVFHKIITGEQWNYQLGKQTVR